MKIVEWSKNLCGGKVTLALDRDDPGQNGAKEALWKLAQHGLAVVTAWGCGEYDVVQPDVTGRPNATTQRRLKSSHFEEETVVL